MFTFFFLSSPPCDQHKGLVILHSMRHIPQSFMMRPQPVFFPPCLIFSVFRYFFPRGEFLFCCSHLWRGAWYHSIVWTSCVSAINRFIEYFFSFVYTPFPSLGRCQLTKHCDVWCPSTKWWCRCQRIGCGLIHTRSSTQLTNLPYLSSLLLLNLGYVAHSIQMRRSHVVCNMYLLFGN